MLVSRQEGWRSGGEVESGPGMKLTEDCPLTDLFIFTIRPQLA